MKDGWKKREGGREGGRVDVDQRYVEEEEEEGRYMKCTCTESIVWKGRTVDRSM